MEKKILEMFSVYMADGAKRLQDWKGYSVYTLTYSGEDAPCDGLPVFVLVKGENIWEADCSEVLELMQVI